MQYLSIDKENPFVFFVQRKGPVSIQAFGLLYNIPGFPKHDMEDLSDN